MTDGLEASELHWLRIRSGSAKMAVTASIPERTDLGMAEPYPGASPNAHFLVGDTPAPTQLKSRWANALSVSFATHVVGFLIIVFLMMMPGVAGPKLAVIDPNKYELTWIPQPGPGGGGGGGGNKQIEPPRQAQLPDKQKITVPVTKPPKVEPIEKPKEPPPKVQELNIPAQATAAGVQRLPGVLSSMPSQPDTTSLGTGTGAGSWNGSRNGYRRRHRLRIGRWRRRRNGWRHLSPGQRHLEPRAHVRSSTQLYRTTRCGRRCRGSWVSKPS